MLHALEREVCAPRCACVPEKPPTIRPTISSYMFSGVYSPGLRCYSVTYSCWTENNRSKHTCTRNDPSCSRWRSLGFISQEAKTFLPDDRCILDGEKIGSQSARGRCALGHVICADCTTQYIEKTRMPQSVVWWDTIHCVVPECTEFMEGGSVRRCLAHRLVERIDAAQAELVSMIDATARRERERERAEEAERLKRASASRAADERASKATMANTTKPCPRCGAPSVKVDGCKHINKCRCGHEYCWDCRREWVRGHLGVTCTPR